MLSGCRETFSVFTEALKRFGTSRLDDVKDSTPRTDSENRVYEHHEDKDEHVQRGDNHLKSPPKSYPHVRYLVSIMGMALLDGSIVTCDVYDYLSIECRGPDNFLSLWAEETRGLEKFIYRQLGMRLIHFDYRDHLVALSALCNSNNLLQWMLKNGLSLSVSMPMMAAQGYAGEDLFGSSVPD